MAYPRPCENNALVRTTPGADSATLGTMQFGGSVFWFSWNIFCVIAGWGWYFGDSEYCPATFCHMPGCPGWSTRLCYCVCLPRVQTTPMLEQRVRGFCRCCRKGGGAHQALLLAEGIFGLSVTQLPSLSPSCTHTHIPAHTRSVTQTHAHKRVEWTNRATHTRLRTHTLSRYTLTPTQTHRHTVFERDSK